LRTERWGNVILSAAAEYILSAALYHLGQFDEAIGHAEAAVRIAEEADHPWTLYWGSLFLGWVHLHRGDFPRAAGALERSLHLGRAWQFVHSTPDVAASLGYVYALTGRTEESLTLVAEAIKAFRARQGHLTVATQIPLQTGRAYLWAERINEAANYAREALALARQLGLRGEEAYALFLTADIAAASGAANAEVYYREALVLAEPRGMRPLIAHCYFGFDKLHRRRSDREQSQRYLTTAIRMYREMGMSYWLEQAEAELRQL
jgi:tetratricopeptide (TPR) repeat protein